MTVSVPNIEGLLMEEKVPPA